MDLKGGSFVFLHVFQLISDSVAEAVTWCVKLKYAKSLQHLHLGGVHLFSC